MPDTSAFPRTPLVPLQLPPHHWSPDGVTKQVSLSVGSLRGTAWGFSSFFHQLHPHWILQPAVVGIYLLGTGTLGWGAWCEAGTPRSQDIHPEFLSTTCGFSPFYISTLPTSLDGCGFSNSIVVRLPCNLISVSSEWRLFSWNFDVVVQRAKPCLHTWPSWPKSSTWCSYYFCFLSLITLLPSATLILNDLFYRNLSKFYFLASVV